MTSVVQFTAPGEVELVSEPEADLEPGSVRVRTRYSGISAGTELTAYRGSNPYLTQTWDNSRRLFVPGEPSFAYPVRGWGYSEVGQVLEVAPGVSEFGPGDLVYGIWGHRSEAVVPAERVHRLPADVEPILGVFGRVGAIALNAVLAGRVVLGDRVAIFGQGVIGLLATGLARLSGAQVLAVDAMPQRRHLAERLGAHHVLGVDHGDGAGAAVREYWPGGADVAIELSGSYQALHQAVRAVGPDCRVVASGFYQGGGDDLRLGEEFHHNRVQLIASQIGATPLDLGPRWNHTRLNAVVMDQIGAGALDASALITDVLRADRVAEAFRLLDSAAPQTLQVVLDFEAVA